MCNSDKFDPLGALTFFMIATSLCRESEYGTLIQWCLLGDGTMLNEPYFEQLVANQPDPSTRSYQAHALEVRQFSDTLRFHAESFLDAVDFEDMVSREITEVGGSQTKLLATTCLGSDGRKENAACSPLDLIVFAMNSGLDNQDAPIISKRIVESFRRATASKLIGEIEIKFCEEPLTFYEGKVGSPWPDRVTDALAINPIDHDFVMLMRDKLATELNGKSNPDLSRRILHKIQDRIKDYRRVSRMGTQKYGDATIQRFDLDQGLVYFNDSISRTGIGPSSFKQSLLRLVQSCVNKIIFRTVAEANLTDGKAFLRQLPNPTEERVDFFREIGLVSSKRFQEGPSERLKDNYSYFLWQYHRSEYAFSHRRETAIAINGSEAKDRRDDLVADATSFANALGTSVSIRVAMPQDEQHSNDSTARKTKLPS